MIEMTLARIAEVVGGVAHGDAVVGGAAFIDTRAPEQDGLFVAIQGQRVDGHDFVESAVTAGAAAVLGSRPTQAPTVVVDDPVAALGTLARHVLSEVDGVTVHAITGSQGKTGVKDYLATILEGEGETVATRGNFNNEIGVPLTVLRVTPHTRHLVVEMGARGIGHIAYLCSIARPDVAAVLNVGTAHVGEFGGREAIAQAKGEIIEALTPDGVAVLNADDALVAAMAPRTPARVMTWGSATDETSLDLTYGDVDADDLDRAVFTLRTHDGASARVALQQSGHHQVLNATAAAAMATSAGVSLADAAARLCVASSRSRWRMETAERADGLLVINDAYNANPESMRAALASLAGIGQRTGRRRVAVLGEMYELGEGSEQAHAQVGGAASEAADVLLAIGELTLPMAHAFASHNRGEVIHAAGRDEAMEWLRHNVSAADVVLVKASRGAALEVIADALLTEGSSNE